MFARNRRMQKIKQEIAKSGYKNDLDLIESFGK